MVRLPRFVSFLSLLLAALLLAACSLQAPLPTASEALADDPELSELTQALIDAGLVDDVEAADSITIFAPTDAAFAALATAQVGLPEILLYHVADGAQTAAQLENGEVLGTFYANSTLAVAIAGDVSLVDGGSGATVVATDIEIANGVIHKIDAVLTPPDSTAAVATDAGLSALVDALVATGLDATFADVDAGPFTVFAPSNQAFVDLLGALGFADLNAMVTALGATQVAGILQYHVVSGIVGEAAVVDAIGAGGAVTTLLGQDVNVSLDGSSVVLANPGGVGPATVTATNIVTANGVVHLIDEVLVPSFTYALNATGAAGTDVSGTVTFEKVSPTETRVTIDLTGTPAGGVHPAHIHVGSNPPGGGIYISLNDVDGDTGESTTIVTQTDASDPITFEELISYDGYVNVHLSADMLSTVVATGETGFDAELVAP